MKMFWTILITAIISAAIAVGGVFLVRYLNDNSAKKGENNTTCKIEYLDAEYDVGDDIVFRFKVNSDIEFTSLTYKLATDEEQTIEGVKFGENAEDAKVGKYYADTKVQVISTSGMTDAYYTLSFYGYDKDGNRYEITESPYSFKLNVIESEAPAEAETEALADTVAETPAAA